MEIEEVKTWQWMLAGLLAGFAFSCIVAWTGPTFDTQGRDTIEQGQFENSTFALTKFAQASRLELQWHKDSSGKVLPLLKDVTVHPPIAGDPDHIYWVTGRSYFVGLKPADPSKVTGPEKVYEEWRPFKYAASTPYSPGFTVRETKKLAKNPARNKQLGDLKKALGGQAIYPTVKEYLKAVSALPNADFKFQYAWWELPGPKYSLPPLAGFLMIGVAWPLTLSVLQNFGVAKRVPVKVKTPARAPVAAQPVRPSGPPVVIAPGAPKALTPGDTRQYGGEFYPVVKATHKE